MPFHATRFLIAVWFLAAALLKVHYLSNQSLYENRYWNSRYFLLLLVLAELFIGFWLLSGHAVRGSRWVALSLFAAFVVFNLYLAYSGDVACPCMGGVGPSPWVMAGLDLAAVWL